MSKSPVRAALMKWLMGADEGGDRSAYGTDSPNEDAEFEFGNKQTEARRRSPHPSTDPPGIYYTELMEYARGEESVWMDELFDSSPGEQAIPAGDFLRSPSPPADDGINSDGMSKPSATVSVTNQGSERDNPKAYGGGDSPPAAERSSNDSGGESAEVGANTSPIDLLSTAVKASRDRADSLETSILNAVDESGIEPAVASVETTSNPFENHKIRQSEDLPDLHESIANLREEQRQIEAGVEQATGTR